LTRIFMGLRNQPPLDFAAGPQGWLRMVKSARTAAAGLSLTVVFEQMEDVSEHLGKEQLVSRLDQPNGTTYITCNSLCQEFAEAKHAGPIVGNQPAWERS
jgi:hypothetical protein